MLEAERLHGLFFFVQEFPDFLFRQTIKPEKKIVALMIAQAHPQVHPADPLCHPETVRKTAMPIGKVDTLLYFSRHHFLLSAASELEKQHAFRCYALRKALVAAP